jgi:hypothetical protein
VVAVEVVVRTLLKFTLPSMVVKNNSSDAFIPNTSLERLVSPWEGHLCIGFRLKEAFFVLPLETYGNR